MKKLYKSILVLSLLGYLLSNHSFQGIGQEKDSTDNSTFVTGGFGIMEVLNVGFDLENRNSQAGFKIGGLAAGGESLFSLSADYSYYFAGRSKIANNRTWFGKVGVQYFLDKAETFSEKATGIITRVGKRFYFSSKAGVKIDIGLFFRIHHEEYYNHPPFIDFDWPVMPGMGISFFYNL